MKHIAAMLSKSIANTLLQDITKHTRIGLAGAQRTGKSTLAEHYSRLTGLPFVVTSVSEIMAEIGFDTSGTYNNDFKTRLDAQVYLLGRLDEEWSKHTGGFITDRTPMCMAMYTLADIVGTTELSDEDNVTLLKYLDKCKQLTMKHFTILVNTKYNPNIALVAKAGSAPAKRHHILHLETLLKSLLVEIDIPTGSDPLNFHEICDGEYDHALHRVLEAPKGDDADARFGGIENQARATLLDIDNASMTLVDLPFSANTVEERVEWLHGLVVTDAFNWLDKAFDRLRDSPLLDAMTKKLYKTVTVEEFQYRP